MGLGLVSTAPASASELSLTSRKAPQNPQTKQPAVRHFGDYELLEEIARGGMGVVYRARQLSLNRQVAVKVLLFGRFASDEFVKRFQAEAEAVASLKHPNIVAIYEIGEHEGQHYFSMDFIQGQDLASRAKDNPVPPEMAADYLKSIARAMHYAHEHGVLHRDLKPSNILIDPLDEPHITDFGLAKRLHKDSELTLTGQVLGTPNFMAPEQAAGSRTGIGPRSDVYSLGAILYYLLTGRAPFLAESFEKTMYCVQHSDPVAPRLLNPSVPRDLETIALKCLQKDPRARYDSAEALAEDLDFWLAGKPILARPVSLYEKAWCWCRRQPTLAASAAAIVLLLLLMTIGSSVAALRIAAAREGERRQRLMAEQRELSARQNLYVMDMNLAHIAAREGDLQRASMLLGRNQPQPGQSDLRGWEWRYLAQLCIGDELFTVGSHSNFVTSVSFSPEGRLLASGSHDGTVKVWNSAAQQLLRSFNVQNAGMVKCLAFSPDGRLLAAGGESGLTMWETSTWRILTNSTHHGLVYAISFSSNADRLAVRSADGEIQVWDLHTLRPTSGFRVAGLNGAVREVLKFSPDGKLLAVGSAQENQIHLVDPASGRVKTQLVGHGGNVTGLAFSPDGNKLASCGEDNCARLWDVVSGQELLRFTNHTAWVSAIAFSPDGKRLFSASADQTVRVWDANTGLELTKLLGHEGEVWGLAISRDGQLLATGGKDGAVKVWRADVTPHRSSYYELPRGVRRLELAPDGDTYAILTWSGRVLLGSTRSNLAAELQDHFGCNMVTFSPAGNLLLTADREGILQSWDPASKRQLRRWEGKAGQVLRLDFSRDGKRLCALDQDGNMTFWEVLNGRVTASTKIPDPIWRDESAGPDTVALSPEFDCYVVGCGLKALLIDVSSGKTLATLKGHKGEIWGIAFAPNGKLIATAGNDGLVKLWDSESHAEVASFRAFKLAHCRPTEARNLGWMPDFPKELKSGGKTSLRIWRVFADE